jgi:hypothetical protein
MRQREDWDRNGVETLKPEPTSPAPVIIVQPVSGILTSKQTAPVQIDFDKTYHFGNRYR